MDHVKEIASAVRSFAEHQTFTDERDVMLGDFQGNVIASNSIYPRAVHWHNLPGEIHEQGIAILSSDSNVLYQENAAYASNPPRITIGRPPRSDKNGPFFVKGGSTSLEGITNQGSVSQLEQYLARIGNPHIYSIFDFRIRPTDSPSNAVYMEAGWYSQPGKPGREKYFSGQTVSLASAVSALSSGEHRLAKIFFDRVTGQPGFMLGPTVSAAGVLPSPSEFTSTAVGQLELQPGQRASGEVYLYYSQTSVAESHIYRTYDPRLGLGVIDDAAEFGAAYNYFSASHYRIGYGIGVDSRRLARTVEPAIDLGAGGSWEDEHVKDPCVVIVDGVIWIFYAGQDGSVFKIGVARSFDGGTTFTKYGSNPILSASQSWENAGTNQIAFPAVLYDLAETDSSKRWKMWYAGGAGPGQGGIGYAYSSDGLSWTKYTSNPVLVPISGWEDTYLIPGAAIRLSDTFYLFYNGNDGSGTWQAGLATFTDPEGTYTRSADNPLLISDGITTAITANVAVGDLTITVTSSAVFPIGAAVHVYDGSNHYLSYVTALPSSTTVTLQDGAPVAISSTGGNMRSAAYNSVFIKSAVYDGGWQFGLTGFQPLDGSGNLRELSLLGYADNDLAAIRIDYSAGLIIHPTLAESQNTDVSYENPSIAPLTDTPRRFLATGGTSSGTFNPDSILTDDDGNVLSDNSGNVLLE